MGLILVIKYWKYVLQDIFHETPIVFGKKFIIIGYKAMFKIIILFTGLTQFKLKDIFLYYYTKLNSYPNNVDTFN